MTKKSNKELFQKELKRLQQGIKKYEELGFTDLTLPTLPKRVTSKQLQKIKELKPKDIAKQSTYISHDTGEILTGEQGLQLLKDERKRKKEEQKQVSNVQIIEIVRDKILTLVDYRAFHKGGKITILNIGEARNSLIQLLDDITIQDDIKPVLDYLYSVQGELAERIETINMDSEEERVKQSIARAFEILKGAPLNQDEAYQAGIYSDYMGEDVYK